MLRPRITLTKIRLYIFSSVALYTRLFFMALFFGICSQQIAAQNIIYDRFDIVNNYNSTCYDEKINFFPSVLCTNQIEGAFNSLPVYSNLVYNSGYAKGLNDGPAWQGKGINITFGAGFSGRVGRFSYVINPIFQYAENRSFQITSPRESRQEFQYPFSEEIDYVTRFGNDPVLKIFPGQSDISLSFKPVTFSLSTQNMRWGSALFNPIVMSTNAPGIPHFRIGTNKPWETKIGNFESNLMWGYLKESDYFNTNSNDDVRYFSGFTFGYQPSFFEGFSIGLNRILYTQTDYLTNFFYDGFIPFSGFFNSGNEVVVNGSLTNDVYDQIASITFHWENETKDFQFYAEWARGDFASGIMDLLTQPEHNRAYTFGAWKEFPIMNARKIRIIYEHTSLAVWQTLRLRAGTSIYTHQTNKQGFTNNGQIIGSSIGPGSSADIFLASYFWKSSSLAFEYQRTRYNDDYYYTNFTTRSDLTPQDIEHQVGIAFEEKRKHFSYRLASYVGIRTDYYFELGEIKNNLHTDLSIKYHF